MADQRGGTAGWLPRRAAWGEMVKERYRSSARVRAGVGTVAVAAVALSTSGFTYTVLVSGPDGTGAAVSQTSVPSNFPSVSGDGRYVAYLSPATNLVAADTNGWTDAFVRDVVTNKNTLLSVSSTGVQANGPTLTVVAAADGRHFLFTAGGTSLTPGDANATADVFVRDTTSATTTLVSATATGASGNNASSAEAISSDGHYVAFDSLATNLVSDDTNGVGDVYVRDMTTGQTTRGSLGSAGQQLAAESTDADLSANGRYLAFVTRSSEVVPGVGNGFAQVYVRDLTTGQVTLISKTPAGLPAGADSRAPSVSADGKVVLFESAASDVVAGDSNGASDIFRYDGNTGAVTRISVGTGGVEANGASSLSYPQHKGLDDAGCHAVFQSDASNLVANDVNNTGDVFVWDCADGSVRRVSLHPDDVHQAAFASAHAAISADGNYVAFASRDPLQSYDTNNHPDVYERFVGAQPVITSVSPTSVTRGVTTTLTINGSGFTQRFSAMLPTGMTLASVQWVSSTKVTISVSVSSAATPGQAVINILDLGTGPGATAGSLGSAFLTVV